MALELKVFTLNCWGVRVPILGAKDVSERMHAIRDTICSENYDLVVLEEVWSIDDYSTLSCKILDKLPYTHFFYSGYLSGGVCIFSRYPIIETSYCRFPLNGHAHKILHGDWYGSKGCGLAVLKVKDMAVNIYATHMHAKYNHVTEFDEYLTHRAAQAFTLSQFVRLTSQTANAVIVTGDFNTTPNEVAYRVIRGDAALKDAWLDMNGEGVNGSGSTCDTPDNVYTLPTVASRLPTGQRIDYIFYRANHMTDIVLNSCTVVKDKIPNTNTDVSDHFALQAKFLIKPNITAGQNPELNDPVRHHCLKELSDLMDKGIGKARYTRYFYFVLMLISIMLLLMMREQVVGEVHPILHTILEIAQVIMAIMAAISLWISACLSHVEQNAHLCIKMDAQNIVKSNLYTKMKN